MMFQKIALSFFLILFLVGCKDEVEYMELQGKEIKFETTLGTVYGGMNLITYSDGTNYCMPLVLFLDKGEKFCPPQYSGNQGDNGNYIIMRYYGVKIEGEGVLVYYEVDTHKYQVFYDERWTADMFHNEEKAKRYLKDFIERRIVTGR